jgi:tRNA pseudouridine55 synthase
VVGVEKATRLLGHLALTEKEYLATIRLGEATDTGDADGTVLSARPAAGLALADVQAAAAALTGPIQQVPPATSAIKVGGRRAYQLARAGRAPELAARPVTVHEFSISDPRPSGGVLDVTAAVRCSSGTYVRALARDLGESLEVGGHLILLRRTRVGPYRIEDAHSLAELAADLRLIPLADAAAAAFPVRALTGAEAESLAHGATLPPQGAAGTVAALAPDGTLIALVEERQGRARPLAVFVP